MALGERWIDLGNDEEVASARAGVQWLGSDEEKKHFDEMVANYRKSLAPPPTPPDLGDDVVQRMRKLMLRKLLSGNGLQTQFLSGPLGDLSPLPAAAPSLTGS